MLVGCINIFTLPYENVKKYLKKRKIIYIINKTKEAEEDKERMMTRTMQSLVAAYTSKFNQSNKYNKAYRELPNSAFFVMGKNYAYDG